jgi:hypothetical protein
MTERVMRVADINVTPLIDVMLPCGARCAERIGLLRREPDDQ